MLDCLLPPVDYEESVLFIYYYYFLSRGTVYLASGRPSISIKRIIVTANMNWFFKICPVGCNRWNMNYFIKSLQQFFEVNNISSAFSVLCHVLWINSGLSHHCGSFGWAQTHAECLTSSTLCGSLLCFRSSPKLQIVTKVCEPSPKIKEI